MTKTRVTLDTRTVGQGFGTCGVIKSAKTGRVLAESDTTRPFNFVDAAIRDAQALAEKRGYMVVESDDE